MEKCTMTDSKASQLPADHDDVFSFTPHKNYDFDTFVPDMDAFCNRIKYFGPLTPTLDVLKSLHFHFVLTFPFENLSILGLPHTDEAIPVPMDPKIIENKLLRQGRGGYCFEMNQYFSIVLRHLGFTIVTKSARVLWQFEPGFARPRSHLVTLVWIDNARYLCDVSFGANSPPMPLLLDTEALQTSLYDTYRITSLPTPQFPAHHKVLEIRRNEPVNKPSKAETEAHAQEWLSMYFFDEHELSTIADWEQANFHVCMYPGGLFSTHVLVGLTTLEGRVALFDNKFVFKKLVNNVTADVVEKKKITGGEESVYTVCQPFAQSTYGETQVAFEALDEREISSMEEYVDILRNKFQLTVPDEKRDSLKLITGK